jgi:hypothetical protein
MDVIFQHGSGSARGFVADVDENVAVRALPKQQETTVFNDATAT